MNYPRMMIAGTQSGVGKTTVILGLMSALRRRGLKVQPFKAGPDYIDSGLHLHAAGLPAHNLDSWMGTPATVCEVFGRHAARADLSVIEGVMGLFDGARGEGIKGSSADIALILKAPVLLVINVRGMAQSAVALVKGFRDYRPDLSIGGLILNRASAFHRTWTKSALEEELGIPVMGCLEAAADIAVPERHLGLLPAEENPRLAGLIDRMAQLAGDNIDLDKIVRMAHSAPPLDLSAATKVIEAGNVRIAVARDPAFTFYYQDSLDYLEELGAELIPFSPMHDRSLPEVDGLYLGGGFPEMFLPVLTANHDMKESIRQAHQDAMPIWAECGGYLYLSRQITDWSGHSWNGVGIVPARVQMAGNLQALGYVQARAVRDSLIAAAGDVLRGHEFHYSQIEGLPADRHAFALKGGRNPDERKEGYVEGNLFASYLHLHLRSNPGAVRRFLAACRSHRRMRPAVN
jgi:cobyrinic acid a,c-diamide synthase